MSDQHLWKSFLIQTKKHNHFLKVKFYNHQYLYYDHFLKKFSISDAAIAYKRPRSTIVKYIKSGDFKLDYNNLIEYSDLIRKFGELTSPIQDEREQQIKKLKVNTY